MNLLAFEYRACGAIAWITMLTGALQMALPLRLLPILGVEPSAAAGQLFATVGMFMLLFGAALAHALRQPQAASVVLLWTGLQKLGAALLVAWGVMHAVFNPLALLVAAFDFLSGLLLFDLRRRTK